MTDKNTKNHLKKYALKRSKCPLACTLDLIGDRWTMLILRDLFRGKRRYKEFQESREGITTNILADRLQRLHEFGLVDRNLYQDRPKRYEYELTKTGRSLEPVIISIAKWGQENIAGTSKPIQ